MSNVIPFPTPKKEDEYSDLKNDVMGGIFQAAITANIYGEELGMSDYDVDYLAHLAKKYSNKWDKSYFDEE